MRKLLTIVLATAAAFATPAVASAEDSTYVAHLRGDNEVPARDTRAVGNAVLRVDDGGTSISYRLIVANIDNVVAAHIHLGTADVNGPVVAFLAGPAAPGSGATQGVLATGAITEADLIGPLAGRPLSELLDAIASGAAYVNVHTNDGVAPTNTGPGDFPGGEIRGQLG